LFLGFLKFENKQYLLFVEQVNNKPFFKERVSIFQICSVKAVNFETGETNKYLTQIMNIVYTKGYFFSYDFDMTRVYTEIGV